MHPLLLRQLKKVLGTEANDLAALPSPLAELSRLVDKAYQAAEDDRELSERSMEIASHELGERNVQLMAKNRALEAAEKNLRLSHDELERRVCERTMELQAAKEQAEAANRAKSSFLANMSHEIRTPMSAILGYAEMLQEKDLKTEGRLEYARTIRRQGEYLLTVLNDILDLSKIEAGKLHIERIRCDPCLVIGEAVSLMRVRALEKKLRCELRFCGMIPETIETDPTRLRQIVLNLLGNAIKFTHEGGVEVTIRMLGIETETMRIEVRDSGIGISPEQAAQLFMPFVQGDASTTRRYGGTGLGLSICKRLTQMLGGDIKVESLPEGGSCISFTIATGDVRHVRHVFRSCEGVPDVAQAPNTVAQQLRARILLAEDGEHNQKVFRFFLEAAGATVTVGENGRVACDLALAAMAEGAPYDLIFMDMQMPEMDGYGAAELLRNRGYGGPIIALTAHAMAGDRAKCLASGCSDYLTKPIDRAQLVAMVAKHTAKQTAGTPITGTGEVVAARLTSCATDPDMLEFVRGFVAGLPRQLERILISTRQSDVQSLARVLHELKGSGGMFGFPDITEVACRAETALLAAGTVDAVREVLLDLEAIFNRIEGFPAPGSQTTEDVTR